MDILIHLSASCLPKTTTVSHEVKPLVKDWHLQVKLFSQVEIGFFKVFQADPYKYLSKYSIPIEKKKCIQSLTQRKLTYCTINVSMESGFLPQVIGFLLMKRTPIVHGYLLTIKCSFQIKITQRKFWTLR